MTAEFAAPGLAPARPSTVLDELRADFAAHVGQRTTTLPIPGRSGYAVRYRLPLDGEERAGWAVLARDPVMPGGISLPALYRFALVDLMVALVKDGEDVVEQGRPLTVRDEALHRILGVDSARDALVTLYGGDPGIEATHNALAVAAGWGQRVEPDPTSGR